MASRSSVGRASLYLAAGAVVGAFAIAAPVRAAETINLTAIDGYPPKALWVDAFIKSYIPEIDKRLAKTGHYKINWNQAWAGQIGKVSTCSMASRRAWATSASSPRCSTPTRCRLNEIAYATPFVTSDVGLVARTFDELADEYQAIQTPGRSTTRSI